MRRAKLNLDSQTVDLFRKIAAVAALTVAIFVAAAIGQQKDQKSFATPEDASQALYSAVRNNDQPALLEILGPDGKDIVSSGDPAEDAENRAILAEKYGENPAVVNAIGAHHDEMEMQYVISPIVQACDAISGARPGARREIMQQYLQRIKDLENLALAYQGVEKAYAIQAGRELRVIVEAEKVTDADSDKLSFEIAQKIQTEMTYPGQIKVTVIREKRAVNVAR